MSALPAPGAGLPPIGGRELVPLLDEVERRMRALATAGAGALGAPAERTIAAGGKRLRPLLVFLAAGVPAPQSDELLRAAVAVELVHSATLVHDDVLDGASLRRGAPTVFATGGRLAATATGDFLFARAFGQLAEGRSIDAVRILSRAATLLAEGELMQRADAWSTSVTVERYLERCRLKTASLFRAACELGARAGGGDVELLGDFGDRIGLAFQLLDDVLDVTGPPERTGKPRGADLLDGTVTLPLILARERDRRLHDLDPRSVLTPAGAGEVAERITATGVLDEVRARALAIVAEARGALEALPAAQRQALELVAAGVVDRYA